MTYTCQCCGFAQDFADGEAAFQAGWDCPPHFTGYVCCNLCPGSWVVLGCTHKHREAHERWAKEGRPAEFELPDDAPEWLRELQDRLRPDPDKP